MRTCRHPLTLRSNAAPIVAAIAVLLPCLASGQTGTNAYSFLEIPTSSHAYALGGSGVAVIDDDVLLTDQNPALMGPEVDRQLAFNYMLYYGSANFAGVRYGMGIDDRSAWAAGIRYLNYGQMTQYESDGTASGTFTPQDIVVEGTYSRDIFDRLRGGANFKMVYSNYEAYSALALAVDLGINYYNEDNDLSLSLVLSNMGGQVKRFHHDYDRLPFNITIGYMQGLGQSPFSLAITATNLTRWKLPYYNHKEGDEEQGMPKQNFGSNLFRHLIFGLQYAPSDKFYIALAYNYKTRTDMSAYQRNFLSGFSLGLGLKVKSFRVGVSYAMPHKSASTLALNLSTDLGALLR